MQMTAEASKLRQIRNALGVSRDDVLRRTRTITLSTIRNAEVGNNRIQRDKAKEILSAMNSLLEEAGKPLVTLDELGLTLYEMDRGKDIYA
jgi:predicted transcriptional regulator